MENRINTVVFELPQTEPLLSSSGVVDEVGVDESALTVTFNVPSSVQPLLSVTV